MGTALDETPRRAGKHMVWFHICTANHNPSGRTSLVDQIDWVSAGLLDAGHRVTMSQDYAEPSAVNLLWECFSPETGRIAAESGLTYGIVATEIFDGTAFNWRDEVWWQERHRGFVAAAERASFIWALVECSIPYYSQFAPTGYLELGFSERLIPPYIDDVPSVDFSFFGQRTPYREAAIAKIRRHASVDWPEVFMPHAQVHAMIARSKIGLNFKQSEEWPVPSGTRLGRLLMAKRGVASEHLAIATRQGEIAGICPADRDFIDFTMGLLSTWRQKAEDAFALYRETLPMGRIVAEVIEQTVSGRPVAREAPASAEGSRDARPIEDAVELFPPPATSVATTDPVLVGHFRRWNIVYFKGRYFAIPVSWGYFDLDDRSASRILYIAESRHLLEYSLSRTSRRMLYITLRLRDLFMLRIKSII